TAVNTIIAANSAQGPGGANASPGGPDFFGTLSSASYNLLGDGTGSNLAPANPDANGNIVGSATVPIDPPPGPPADNGGPTPTHALLNGSPAFDAGDPNFTPPPTTDQRGSPRVPNGRIDIGAYESVPPAVPTHLAITPGTVVSANESATNTGAVTF